MEWIQSILKTDNIAIAICLAGLAISGWVIKLLWDKITKLEEANNLLIAEVNFLKGQNSMVEIMANFTTMIKKMDEKIDLLHAKKLNR